MPKICFCLLISFVLSMSVTCTHQPNRVEIMRQEKAQKDSLKYMQAKQNLRYSDSVLQVMLPEVDPMMKNFVYNKNEKMENHGHYVHRLLQTTSNTSRNFIQAYIADNHTVSVQSYYNGSHRQNQRAVRLMVGQDYVEKEGGNHSFQTENWHEILTIEGEDALQILSFLASHSSERVVVKSVGNNNVEYVLTKQECQALAETYQLAVLMRDINALERAIHVADLQIQKYEKKHTNCK